MKKLHCIGVAMAVLAIAGCRSAPQAKTEYKFVETTVFIDSEYSGGAYKIPATVTMPEGAKGETFPGVVMLHGFGSNRDEAGGGYKLFAPELAKNGIASIRIDFMGNGESALDYAGFTLDVGEQEAERAAAYLTGKYPQIDKARIGIMGWSMGGGIALLAAGRQGDAYKTVLTWAGAPLLSDAVYSEAAYAQAKEKGVSVVEFDWREPLNIGLAAFEIAYNTDILKEFSQSRAAVLAINGGEDTTVTPDTAELIRKASSNAKSEASILGGADHTFNIFSGDMAAFNALMQESLAWFKKTL
jgi:dienelactone hydrolase